VKWTDDASLEQRILVAVYFYGEIKAALHL